MTQQIGGDHYAKMTIQPVEFILKNNIGFAEGNVIKYVSRWREKGGVEDLKKARHYLDMLIESQPEPVKQRWALSCGEPVGTLRNQRTLTWECLDDALSAMKQMLEMLVEKGLAGDADLSFPPEQAWIIDGEKVRLTSWTSRNPNNARGWVWTTRAGAQKALDAILEEMK